MDILDALDEIRMHNARSAQLGVDGVLERHQRSREDAAAASASAVEHEDQLEAERAFAAARVKRLRDEEDEDDEGGVDAGRLLGSSSRADAGSAAVASVGTSKASGVLSSKAAAKKPRLPMGMVVQPKVVQTTSTAAPSHSTLDTAAPSSAVQGAASTSSAGGGLAGLLGDYDSSSASGSGSPQQT
jgi:hypothetical protein